MPTFTTIALDRLLDPGASKSVEKSALSGKLPNLKPPISKMERRNSQAPKERNVACPQISPALYVTPEAIPLPDSPSSFPPSPYIINHKARGPRLLKTFSVDDVSSRRRALNEGKSNEDPDSKSGNLKKSTSVTFSIPEPVEVDHANGTHGSPAEKNYVNGIHGISVSVGQQSGINDRDMGRGEVEMGSSNRGLGSSDVCNGSETEKDLSELVDVNRARDGEYEDFYDPAESMSFASNTELEDDAGVESSQKQVTPLGEFYDAWEELSSDSGMQASVRNIEAELSEIRQSLLMEIEKRKQAEEDLNHMQSYWQRIREQLAQVGLALPADPIVVMDYEEPNINVAEELCHQFDVARFVSDSIGRGIAKAEVEMEMEAKIEAKNFEIARLSDRLHYHEAVNREMSLRNQEAIEAARRDRQRRKRRQRWIWGSIAATITLGSAALAWSYLPSVKVSSSSNISQAPHQSDE